MKKLLLVLLLVLTACSDKVVHYGPYSIGRDETWYPLELDTLTENLTAFTTVVVQEIAKMEHLPLQLLAFNSSQLLDALDKEEVGGLLTLLEPTVITSNKYHFSEPILKLGPVLVVPQKSDIKNLADMKNKIIGVYQFDNSVLIAQQYPTIVIQTYQNKAIALEELVQGKIDGILIPILDAQILIPYIDSNQVKIVGHVLDQKALRLITLKNKNSSLVKYFNRGLQKMHHSGTYQTLCRRYLFEK